MVFEDSFFTNIREGIIMYNYPQHNQFYGPRNSYPRPRYYLPRQPRQNLRRLTIRGNIHIKDFEWPGSDEHCNLAINRSVWITNTEYGTVFSDNLGCGGECRTELEIQAKVLPGGDILVNVFSRFYEGTSEVTTELEDHKETWHLLVKVNSDVPIVHNLANTDVLGQDTSTVALRFTNTLVED